MSSVGQPVSASAGDRVRSIPTLVEARYSQSLERGLAILECFTPERRVWGIAELADELGMSRSTTHRYALTLTELGYLLRAPRRRYRMGLRVTNLGLSALSSTSLSQHARPYLEELSRRAPYTLVIGVLDGPEILCVDSIQGTGLWPRLVDLGLGEGARPPAHCTAMGKLLMASLPARERRELIAEMKLERWGPHTITSKTRLRGELAHLGEDVVAGDEELAPKVYEIAAPVRDGSGEVFAAIEMVAHASRISLGDLAGHLAPHLITTADRISAQLGYRRRDESVRPPRPHAAHG